MDDHPAGATAGEVVADHDVVAPVVVHVTGRASRAGAVVGLLAAEQVQQAAGATGEDVRLTPRQRALVGFVLAAEVADVDVGCPVAVDPAGVGDEEPAEVVGLGIAGEDEAGGAATAVVDVGEAAVARAGVLGADDVATVAQTGRAPAEPVARLRAVVRAQDPAAATGDDVRLAGVDAGRPVVAGRADDQVRPAVAVDVAGRAHGGAELVAGRFAVDGQELAAVAPGVDVEPPSCGAPPCT